VTQPFPGAQSTDPNQAAQGIGQGQGAGAGPGGTPNNAALGLINQLLTTPRQPPAGVTTGGGTTPSGGLGIAGIASKYEGASLKIYHDHQKFKEWEFIFDPNANAPQAPAPTNPLGNGTNPTGTTTGTSPAGQTSPFGTSSTTSSTTSGTTSGTSGAMPSIGP
jgi:hypothetical protein